jgi:hypothetical protein
MQFWPKVKVSINARNAALFLPNGKGSAAIATVGTRWLNRP